MNFLFFWRLSREKGFDLLIEALSRIAKRPEGLPGNFCIFGEGDLRKQLFEAFVGSPVFEDGSGWDAERINIAIEESLSRSDEWPDFRIFFFGWQSKATIEGVLKVSHFSLMPSRFLETFGLSALESLAEGVPVIGFKKGWLVPFIPEELALPFSDNDQKNIKNFSKKIVEISERYSEGGSIEGNGDETTRETDWKSLSNASRLIADSYTEGRWMRQVRDMLPKHTKKILLATDYVTLLGGIETHVQTIAKALRHHGYEVEVFGWDLPKGRWTKLLRLGGLVYSLCNITSALGMRKKIREFEPDAIWLHSVSRFLGPLTVREVVKWSWKKGLSESLEKEQSESPEKWWNLCENQATEWAVQPYGEQGAEAWVQYPPGHGRTSFSETSTLVTYHDLGLWSPFPSQVESEDMVPKHPSIGAFLGIIDSKNPIVYLAAYCKYFQISLLRKLLKGIDIHIVPSAFLSRYVRDISEVPEERVVVLKHFL